MLQQKKTKPVILAAILYRMHVIIFHKENNLFKWKISLARVIQSPGAMHHYITTNSPSTMHPYHYYLPDNIHWHHLRYA
jgi:hypothetical protein